MEVYQDGINNINGTARPRANFNLRDKVGLIKGYIGFGMPFEIC